MKGSAVNLISESYRQQNYKLHENVHYGTSGHQFAGVVSEISERLNTRDILDYGCGKKTLEQALGFSIKNYDPCVAGLDSEPLPADLVVCGDVLEHIEPDYLDSVLDDLARVTKNTAFLVVDTVPALKTLSDGRNAHLIQEGTGWWMPKIMARFNLKSFTRMKHKLLFICEKL